MARGFGTTSGAAATDRVLTTLSAKTTLRSYSIWVYANAYAGSPRVFDDGGTPVERLGDNGSVWEYLRAWSGSNATWTVARPSTGAWHHFGITYDGSSTANDPLIYVDGTSVTVTETTAPSGTLTTTAQALNLGNRAAQDRVWDGMMAEWGVWDRILSADDMAALGKGFSPMFFRNGLSDYIPMVRGNLSRKLAPPTLTGTVVQPHPRVIHPSALMFPIPNVPSNQTMTVPLEILQYTTFLPTIISDGEYVPPVGGGTTQRRGRFLLGTRLGLR